MLYEVITGPIPIPPGAKIKMSAKRTGGAADTKLLSRRDRRRVAEPPMSDLVYGVNPVREALAGERRRPLELFVAREARSKRVEEVLHEAQRLNLPVRQRERKDLDKLAGHGHHQGLVLLV